MHTESDSDPGESWDPTCEWEIESIVDECIDSDGNIWFFIAFLTFYSTELGIKGTRLVSMRTVLYCLNSRFLGCLEGLAT